MMSKCCREKNGIVFWGKGFLIHNIPIAWISEIAVLKRTYLLIQHPEKHSHL